MACRVSEGATLSFANGLKTISASACPLRSLGCSIQSAAAQLVSLQIVARLNRMGCAFLPCSKADPGIVEVVYSVVNGWNSEGCNEAARSGFPERPVEWIENKGRSLVFEPEC